MRFKSIIAALALVISTGAAAQTYHYESVPGDPMQSRIYTLGNGLKVYLSVNKEKPRLQTFIAVRTGSRNDPAETTGLAHYLEHLMFKGTTHFGSSDVKAEAPPTRLHPEPLRGLSQAHRQGRTQEGLPRDRLHLTAGSQVQHPQRV